MLPLPLSLDPAHLELDTLSLHDALPICKLLEDPKRQSTSKSSRRLIPSTKIHHETDVVAGNPASDRTAQLVDTKRSFWPADRKSTRLNSSHRCISYAVFCLKKKTSLLCQ